MLPTPTTSPLLKPDFASEDGRHPLEPTKKNKKPIDLVQFQGCFNTPLQHTPSNLYQHGYNGTPFIVGERGSGWAVL